MNQPLTLGSLFDGISGFPLAGLYVGMKPVWASEIEPFPIRVSTKRLPFMKHLGDIRSINGGEIEPVDVITFGSPCQNLSVASAKRTGLQGEQSSLFFEAVRVITEMRKKTNGMYPKWAVWENVPYAKLHIRHIFPHQPFGLCSIGFFPHFCNDAHRLKKERGLRAA